MTDNPSIKKQLRDTIVELTSEMLDNPNGYGVYQTTRFYENLEKAIVKIIESEVIGSTLEQGDDFKGRFTVREAEVRNALRESQREKLQ